jgi:hypothetical protein
MSDIIFKYQLLNQSGKKEVQDFIELLLNRQKKGKSKSLSSYKKKILKVSTWSDDDLKAFEENKRLFEHWGAEQW